MPGQLREEPRQAAYCTRTVFRDPREGEKRARADHGEGDRLVRLRLSMLTREKRKKLVDSMPVVVLHGQTPVLG